MIIALVFTLATVPLLPRDALEVDELPPTQSPIELVSYRGMGDGSTDWTGLVIAHFPERHVATALRVLACESGGNPNAESYAGARGLFQIMPFWADHYGVERDALWAAEVNAAVAAAIVRDEGWHHWNCY